MKTYLWKIKEQKLNRTNLAKYSDFIKKNYSFDAVSDFNKIWKWSVENPEKLEWLFSMKQKAIIQKQN